MSYRGYDLEQKTLMVGWQITITKDGKFVQNGSVTKSLSSAIDDAEKFVDRVIAEADTAASGVSAPA
jgi:ABC-type proline/glycine betaine transport system ATPase subunit